MALGIIFRGLTIWVCYLLITTSVSAAGFTLTVLAQGSGSVSKNPSNATYPSGVVVTLTATPNAGNYFSGWSGDTNGAVNPLNVTMNGNLVITGNFQPFPTYTLLLATNGQGNISLNPATTNYYSNTVVTAQATPAAGWVFAGWSGSAAGGTNPLTFTMSSSNSLMGNFAQLPAFDVQPVGKTNIPGSTVSLSAHAVGNSPLTYQWYFNNAAVPGATNGTLTFPNVQFAQAGNYQVLATNNYGSITSSVALLVLTNGAVNPVSVCDEASLRAAIVVGGWISFGCNGTIALSDTITISNSVILDGSLVNAIISGSGKVRLFTVMPGASLTATNLTLANGLCLVTNGAPGTPADAGAIYNDAGAVTLVSCSLTNNQAQSLIYGGVARGGAIFNNGGAVTISQSLVTSNSVLGGGYNGYSANSTISVGLGGAIYNTNGAVTITGCNLIGNSATNSAENNINGNNGTGWAMGGAVFQASGSMIISNTSLIANQALGSIGVGTPAAIASPAQGGAVAVTGGNLTIQRSQFFANKARGGAAGHHSVAGIACGGAVYSSAVLEVADSSFFGNQAVTGNGTYGPNHAYRGADGFGGAIYNSGTSVLNRSLLYSNYLQAGSVVTLSGYTVGGNGFGGGAYNASELKVTNCTIALNTVVGGEGFYANVYMGTHGTALGGGVANGSNAIISLMNCTIATNTCIASGIGFDYRIGDGLAGGLQIANLNGTARLHNSLLAYAGTNNNAFGTITDGGYNISSDGSAAFSGGTSYNFTDPKLIALVDNGGPTLTMALQSISPAIDFGDSSEAPNIDQRGFIRPIGDGVDIGAFEFGSYSVSAPLTLNLSGKAPSLQLSFTAVPPFTYHLQSSTNLTTWTDEEILGAFSSLSNITLTINPQNENKFFRVWYQ
jgi:hypothetical protein